MTESNRIRVGTIVKRISITHEAGASNRTIRERLQRFAHKNKVYGLAFHRDAEASTDTYSEYDIRPDQYSGELASFWITDQINRLKDATRAVN